VALAYRYFRTFCCDSVAAVTRLAIIDEHQALVQGLEALLAEGDVEVVGSAGNAAAALDLLDHAEPDVLLLEVRLPDASGVDLTRDLLARRPELGVLLYTSDSDAELLYAGLASGARGYALKAGSLRELVEAVELVASGGTYVDPRLDRVLVGERAITQAPQLSPREREVMSAMAEGATAEVAASQLGVSIETVRTHVRNAIRKIGARNRVHAIALALQSGEIRLEPTRPEDDGRPGP
jgi:DNA-binding NarL/FixJ family response regulator